MLKTRSRRRKSVSLRKHTSIGKFVALLEKLERKKTSRTDKKRRTSAGHKKRQRPISPKKHRSTRSMRQVLCDPFGLRRKHRSTRSMRQVLRK